MYDDKMFDFFLAEQFWPNEFTLQNIAKYSALGPYGNMVIFKYLV